MKATLTDGELLIARGINLLIRASFAPADARASAEHFVKLKDDIGPWLTDYAESVAHTFAVAEAKARDGAM